MNYALKNNLLNVMIELRSLSLISIIKVIQINHILF